MNLDIIILGFLNNEPMTGYDLSKKMDISVGFFWHATHSQIYPCLKNLESKGFVVSKHELQTSGPARKIYTITSEGRQELLKNLADIIPPQEGKFPLLVTMFFGAELGVKFWRSTLGSQIQEQQSRLSALKSIKEQLSEKCATDELAVHLKMRTVEFGIGYQKHFINWLEETLETLRT